MNHHALFSAAWRFIPESSSRACAPGRHKMKAHRQVAAHLVSYATIAIPLQLSYRSFCTRITPHITVVSLLHNWPPVATPT